MEISEPDTSPTPRRIASWANCSLEEGLSEFKAEITERPLLYLAVAFVAGFVSCTFPVRLIFSAVAKLASSLLGPAILLVGILKISESFSHRSGEKRSGEKR
jgi:hypothetical protein